MRVIFSSLVLLCMTLGTVAFLIGCAAIGSRSGKSKGHKVALVVGNSAYQYTSPLPNPVNDAKGIATALRELGFDVVEGLDQDSRGMKDALNLFSDKLRGASVGLLFYAGHGIQVSGRNFLLPVDIIFDDNLVARKGVLETRTVLLDEVLAVMDSEPRVNLVFLDACRDNPMVASLSGGGKNQKGRSVDQLNERGIKISVVMLKKGLAQVKARYSHNMFIAYATQPGNVALDGSEENSPFTSALLTNIRIPNLEVRNLLTEVRKSVMAKTDNKQVPWDHASLTEQFYFNPVEKRKAVAPPP